MFISLPRPLFAAPQSLDRGEDRVISVTMALPQGMTLVLTRSARVCFQARLADRLDKGGQGQRSTVGLYHASGDSPCRSSAKQPPLEGLSPSHGAFEEHAAHAVEWSTTLSSKGSSSTCILEVFPHSSMPLSRRTERTL